MSAFAVPAIFTALGGCGAGSHGEVVVRVGAVPIYRADVAHWARAMSLGNAAGASLSGAPGTPRQRALDFLISAHWLLGEAEARGLKIEDRAVSRVLQARIAATPNGRHEFEEELSSEQQTTFDVELEIKAELAAAMLRNEVARRVPAVTKAEAAGYYKRHLERFRIPDQRAVDLIESLPSRAAAIALGRRLGSGRRFAKQALHELVARQTPYEATHRDNHQLVSAIFATSPGRLGGPVMFNNRWVLLVVRRLVPGRTKPLSVVSQQLTSRLTAEHRRLALASSIRALQARWKARTECRAGFVVPKCARYRSTAGRAESPLVLPGADASREPPTPQP